MSEQADYQVVQQSALGRELTDDDCKVLAKIMEVRHLKDDEVLAEEGESNNTLQILTAGRLAVTKTVESEPVMLYILRIGEFAGSRSFVDGIKRQASLRAIGETTVYILAPEPFEALLETHPRIVYQVMRAIFRMAHNTLMRMNREKEQLNSYVYKFGGRY